MQRGDEPGNVTHVDPPISIRRKSAAGQLVNVRAGTANEQDSLSGFDAGVNLRRKDIANKGISQSDQVYVRGEKEAREILERNQARSIDWHAACAQFALDPIGLGAGGIQPESKRRFGPGAVFRIGADERVLVVGDAPVARIKDDPGTSPQFARQWQSRKSGRKSYRR